MIKQRHKPMKANMPYELVVQGDGTDYIRNDGRNWLIHSSQMTLSE